MVGEKFGRLMVLGKAAGAGRTKWLCRCDCGTERAVMQTHLRTGHTQSCGCLHVEQRKAQHHALRHGMSHTPTYTSWMAMIRRCEVPTNIGYKDYGGRGIAVCARWHNFADFLADMGMRPVGTTLDRIDSFGNYEPGNCRWATGTQQVRNRSNTKLVEFNGRSVNLAELVAEHGQHYGRVRARLRIGWTIERALAEPKLK